MLNHCRFKLSQVCAFAGLLSFLATTTVLPAADAGNSPASMGERADAPGQAERVLSVRGTEAALRPGSREPFEFIYGDPSQPQFRYWWNGIPREVRERSLIYGNRSNIRQVDYAGPDACQKCHPSIHSKWMTHSHRLMNALATPETVQGDFSGRQVMDYLGGKANFYMDGGTNWMRLERDGVTRVYAVARTIGSRFFQYYAGKLVNGPEPAEHATRHVDHVLPLGYLMSRREWMPIIHIDEEKPDGQRADAFASASDIPYDQSCSICHTTWPAGDWLMTLAGMSRATYYSPFTAELDVTALLAETHPSILRDIKASGEPPEKLLQAAFAKIQTLPVAKHGVALGVTCEACHNGGQSHAEKSMPTTTSTYPLFFPCSPNLLSHGPSRSAVWTRRPQNLNWTCARCHSGGRPRFAAGMATWNSVEYSDALNGSCYLQDPQQKRALPGLLCVDCHNPHQGIGPKWTRTADEDDAKCMSCHKHFGNPSVRQAHTHHKAGSDGDRCMNCHMPKINEGLQDVVRTHMIFNPTEPRMIEANQPNACNLCHLKENIDWTLRYLKQWYPRTAGPYSEEKLAANYPHRSEPVGLGWLKSPHESTRLVAAEALAKAKADWALPNLIQALDDPYLINRRFTQTRLDEMMGVDLRTFGYRFYQTKAEREKPLLKIRDALPKQAPAVTEGTR
jgi:predicted CXXCH cytochrome family protein